MYSKVLTFRDLSNGAFQEVLSGGQLENEWEEEVTGELICTLNTTNVQAEHRQLPTLTSPGRSWILKLLWLHRTASK